MAWTKALVSLQQVLSLGGSVMTIELVVPLSEIDPGMLDSVGGKAANLGALLAAGFPVPRGFCLTTEAYRRIAGAVGIDGGFDLQDAGRIRAQIGAAPVPAEVAEAIIEAYRRLGDRVAVAIRSSATAEDLPFASFAGQQDSFLGIVGEQAVLEAVSRCWASLWTDRAVAYRTTQGIDQRAVRLAVVVQVMVDSVVAGVLFTANAVTGRRQEAVIDASPGLGESVVSGAVTPDHFVIDTTTARVLQQRRGDNAVVIIMNHAEGGTQAVPSLVTDEPCLDGQQLRALTDIGSRVEQLFGSPQDIEWAFAPDGKLWLTQSRPITTLFPLPDGSSTETGLRAYFNFSVAQGLYRPLTPVGLSAFRLLASGAAAIYGQPVKGDVRKGPPVFAEAGQRIFVDLTGPLRSRVGRAFLPRVFDLMETRSATILRELFDRKEFTVTHRSLRPTLRRVLRVAVQYRIPVYIAQAVISPAAAHRRVSRIGNELRVMLATGPGATGAIEKLDWVEKILLHDTVPMAPRIVPGGLAGLLMFGLAQRLLGRDAGPGELQTVLRGLTHNPTTEMDLRLWDVARLISADDEAARLLRSIPAVQLAARYRTADLPAVITEGLAGFLAMYGHRAVAEIDLGVPRWSDDPTHILGVLANYLRLDDPELAPDVVFARGDREARTMIEQLAATARRRGRIRAATVRFALGRTRQLAGIREMPKNNIVLVLTGARRALDEIGTVLTSNHLLENADDIFFLTLSEIRTAITGSIPNDLVAVRRASYQQEMRRRRVPRVLLSDGTEPEITSNAEDDAGALHGVAASPGVVSGPARVILDPVGAHLEPGEILVALSTDPGWTPLFLTAGGLVMEMGGPNSHGAVVAREYGIPAVVGVPMATERLSTGQQLAINGTTGTVVFEDPAARD